MVKRYEQGFKETLVELYDSGRFCCKVFQKIDIELEKYVAPVPKKSMTMKERIDKEKTKLSEKKLQETELKNDKLSNNK